MKFALFLMLVFARLAPALEIHGIDGWTFNVLGSAKSTSEATGFAKAALSRENPKSHLPVTVLVNVIVTAPNIDRASVASWQKEVIGAKPTTHRILKQGLITQDGQQSYIAHYQVKGIGPLPTDTLLLAMISGNKLYLFSYSNAGATFGDDAVLVDRLYHRLRLDQAPARANLK